MDPRQRAIEAIMAKRPQYVRDAAEDYARAVARDESEIEIIAKYNRLRLALRAYEEGRNAA